MTSSHICLLFFWTGTRKTERLEEDEDEVEEEEEERHPSCYCNQWDKHIETEEEDKKTAEGGKRGRDEREREKTDSGRKKERKTGCKSLSAEHQVNRWSCGPDEAHANEHESRLQVDLILLHLFSPECFQS